MEGALQEGRAPPVPPGIPWLIPAAIPAGSALVARGAAAVGESLEVAGREGRAVAGAEGGAALAVATEPPGVALEGAGAAAVAAAGAEHGPVGARGEAGILTLPLVAESHRGAAGRLRGRSGEKTNNKPVRGAGTARKGPGKAAGKGRRAKHSPGPSGTAPAPIHGRILAPILHPEQPGRALPHGPAGKRGTESGR